MVTEQAARRGRGADSPRADESEKERIDRELEELLQELRVAIPGVQVLFAFLLTIPFAQGFTKVTSGERYTFFASLLAVAAATALLISPTAYHRLHFRSGEKERLLFTSNRLAIGGLALLGVAIALALFVITSFLFDTAAAWVVALLAAAWFGWFWYGLPLSRRRR
jgi:VIT1/CCC1 family predicted Fe2+/Mn2+ transporter